MIKKNVVDFVRDVRSITHALCALREHCAHEWLEVLSFGLPHCVQGVSLGIQSPAGRWLFWMLMGGAVLVGLPQFDLLPICRLSVFL